jgi:hypothetical protein
VTSLLILVACICMAAVTWVSVAAVWIVKELRFLVAVVVPWLKSIHDEIAGKK